MRGWEHFDLPKSLVLLTSSLERHAHIFFWFGKSLTALEYHLVGPLVAPQAEAGAQVGLKIGGLLDRGH
jgi:hypothetical protein